MSDIDDLAARLINSDDVLSVTMRRGNHGQPDRLWVNGTPACTHCGYDLDDEGACPFCEGAAA